MPKINYSVEQVKINAAGDQIVVIATVHDDFPSKQIVFEIEKPSTTSFNDLKTQARDAMILYWDLQSNAPIGP